MAASHPTSYPSIRLENRALPGIAVQHVLERRPLELVRWREQQRVADVEGFEHPAETPGAKVRAMARLKARDRRLVDAGQPFEVALRPSAVEAESQDRPTEHLLSRELRRVGIALRAPRIDANRYINEVGGHPAREARDPYAPVDWPASRASADRPYVAIGIKS